MALLCGTGRGEALKKRLFEDLRKNIAPDRALIVLVPELYTLSSEREIMEGLQLEGSFSLQVLSPARLISRVFQACGAPKLERIDERGRVMLMHAALKNSERQLAWYRGARHLPGFTALAASQIRELKQAGYDPEGLDALARALPAGPMGSKLTDISAIWTIYEEAMRGRYMDGEDELNRAAGKIDRAPFLKGARVWAYGFETVSPTLATLLTRLAGSRDVTLLLPLPDASARDRIAFSPVEKTLSRLMKLSSSSGVPAKEEALSELAESGEASLKHLAREINSFPPAPWPHETQRVRLVPRKNPMEEAMFVMALIRRRVMEGKMRYRDAAIACLDMERCGDAIARAAALYEVPVFLESGRSADRNPLAMFILLSLRLVMANWQTEDVEALMRTGYTALTQDEADIMCDCAVEQGLRGVLWKRPLSRYRDERDAEIEPLREKLVAPLSAFEEAFNAAGDTLGQLTAIWNLLEAVGAGSRLQAAREKYMRMGMSGAAGEDAQVWNRVITTLEQLSDLMADTKLTARDMWEMLSQSLSTTEIKPLPQSGDAVMAGSLNHLRGERVDLLFVMGCNEQRAAAPKGLFQERERDILSGEMGVWLAPDMGDRARLFAIDLSGTLAMAGKWAIFTLSQSDQEGAALRPSPAIDRLKRIFPTLREETVDDKLLLNAPLAAAALLSAAAGSGELDGVRRGALSALAATEKGRRSVQRIRQSLGRRTVSDPIGREMAEKLYGGPHSVSVSRLETFAACPFRHFMQYGLRPVELKPWQVTRADEGNFYHDAVEKLLSDPAVAGMTAEQAVSHMDEVAERLLSPMMDGPLGNDPVMLSHSRRMRDVARRAARTITQHLSGSRFTPCALEVRFGEFAPVVTLHTASGDVPLQGRIDRIDEWRDGDRTWLRIIDYKSGQNTLSLTKLYFGLQLQLIIYLAVALGRKDSRPAGAFYFKIDDPVVESMSRDPDEIEAAREQVLRLSGLYTEDGAVLEAMSPDIDKVITLTLKNDGTPRKSAAKLTAEGFDLLIDYALKAATRLAEGIMSGVTAIEPKRMTGFSSCDTCKWQSDCLQDALMGGMPEPLEPKLKQEEVLDAVREEMERES